LALGDQPWLLGPYDTSPHRRWAGCWPRPGSAQVRVFPSQAAAAAAAASGHGLTLAVAHTVAEELEQNIVARLSVGGPPLTGIWYGHTLAGNNAPRPARALRRFIGMPEATQATLHGGSGVPPRRLHPPTHITLWSGIQSSG
jgi:DNA-binding transcriptional LysR family regulator